MSLRRVIDYALWPALVLLPWACAAALLRAGLPPLWVTPAVVGPLAAVLAALERLRPERAEYLRPDRPLWLEAAHWIASFELGYGLSLLACEAFAWAIRRAIPLPSWPSSWPLLAQMGAAIFVYEATSYWQHRLLHERAGLFRFHALHHTGERLNFLRAGRFHAVDIGTAAFVAYAPLVALRAPDSLFAHLGVLLSALGMLQHANIRMRTPAWLDALVCTPAVHRHHHSRDRAESDRNYGNTVMLFDALFGTYARPRPEGPAAVGIEGDTMPEGFWAQWLAPFRRDDR